MRTLCSLLAALSLLPCLTARAQTTETPPGSATYEAPDAASAPGAASDAASAPGAVLDAAPESTGPAAGAQPESGLAAPPEAEQPPSSVAQHARLRLVSTHRHLVFYGRDLRSGGELDELCRAPCEVALPQGPYELALTDGTADPTVVGHVDVVQGGTVVGEYRSRDRIRRTGLGLLAVSALVGSSLSILASTCEPGTDARYCEREDGFRVTGIALLSAGVVGGLIMVLMPDRARVQWLRSL